MTCAEPASVFIFFEMKTGLGSKGPSGRTAQANEMSKDGGGAYGAKCCLSQGYCQVFEVEQGRG